VDDAIAIAVQIAAALEAAHEKGVVHRDLKPANIVVAPSGRVKVLDFGLAKLAGGTDSDSAPLSSANSPTIAATITGMVLGTAAYMSPEQARGKAVDKRTDIWAFGCVLFEMLAGVPAFAGETITDIVASVVTKEPDWSALPVDTPPSLTALVRRCLRKDPTARLHDVADARIELQESPDSATVQRQQSAPSRRSRSVLAGVSFAAAVFGGAVTWAAMRSARPVSEARPVTRLQVDLPIEVDMYGGNAPGVAVSPDGRVLAFLGIRGGQRQIYIRNLSGFDAEPVRGTTQAQAFFFSPDSASIGFITPDRILKRVSLSDGLVVNLARDADQYSGGIWAPNGRIIFSHDGPLEQVPASGGPVSRLTALDGARKELFHAWPEVLPGDKALLFVTLGGNNGVTSQIEALTIATGKRRTIIPGTFPRYVPSGHLVFYRDKDLLAAPFDTERLELTGPAVRVVEKLGLDFNGTPLASVSAAGILSYVPVGTGTSRLVWVSRDGAEQAITGSAARYQSPRLSPDGARIAVHMGGNLWIHDIARGSDTPMASDDVIGSGFTTWAPGGHRLAFRSRTGMRWVDVDIAGRSQPLEGSVGTRDIPNSFGPDGDALAFTRQDGETSGDIYVMSLSGRFPPRPLVRSPAYEGGAQLSPDGRWFAYASNESGIFQVYVRPYDQTERRYVVSTDGGSYPVWRRDGKELFYRSANRMMSVNVASAGQELSLSPPHMLFERRYGFETSTIANYDVSLDGNRFLMVKDEVGAGRINVVLNWFEELKRLAPVASR